MQCSQNWSVLFQQVWTTTTASAFSMQDIPQFSYWAPAPSMTYNLVRGDTKYSPRLSTSTEQLQDNAANKSHFWDRPWLLSKAILFSISINPCPTFKRQMTILRVIPNHRRKPPFCNPSSPLFISEKLDSSNLIEATSCPWQEKELLLSLVLYYKIYNQSIWIQQLSITISFRHQLCIASTFSSNFNICIQI